MDCFDVLVSAGMRLPLLVRVDIAEVETVFSVLFTGGVTVLRDLETDGVLSITVTYFLLALGVEGRTDNTRVSTAIFLDDSNGVVEGVTVLIDLMGLTVIIEVEDIREAFKFMLLGLLT